MPDSKPLPAGKYTVRCKEKTAVEAATNGHSFAFYPGVVALSNEREVIFYRNDTQVFFCNAVYAADNFEMTKVKA